MDLIEHDGRERVVLDRQEYQDLIDARDHARAMQDIAAGAPTIPDSDMDAYLAAPTPLSYWRRRAGKTQAGLAAEVNVSQPFLAQLEAGVRSPSVGVLLALARVLGVRVEDLASE